MEKHVANEHEPAALVNESDGGQSLQPAEVEIVRTSTPRPLSYAPSSAAASSRSGQAGEASIAANFPPLAPVAPPLPEEPETRYEPPSTGATTFFSPLVGEKDEDAEFVWLFEYGLEMDSTYLNSPERLNGMAIRYGPAMLRGYELHGIELPNGRIAPTLVKCPNEDNEVWGILYRVPRRLLARAGTAPSALDDAHPAPAFEPVQVRVQETYRKRSIECITYLASEQTTRAFAVFPSEQRRLDSFYARQLLRIGKQQGLPAAYLEELAACTVTPANSLSASEGAEVPQRAQGEQDTEPLPALVNGSIRQAALIDAQLATRATQAARWLFALALYLVLLLMAALVLAVMQAFGYWKQFLVAGFTPLGVPWYILLYGLLGGCISCMMALGRLPVPYKQPSRHRRFRRFAKPLPGFVAITWFARPYLGAILAALAYFILNSGLFLLSIEPSQRYAMYAIVGTIAGLSEGHIFFRQGRQ